MSTGREKDQKDYDLERIVSVLDEALTSDNPAVQNALRSLLMIATIVSSEHPDQVMKSGPLSRMFEDMRNLNNRLSRMEDELNQMKWNQQKRDVEPYMPVGKPAVNPYPYTGTGIPPQTWPSTTWTGTFQAGDDPNYKGASSTSKLAEISKYLEEKK